jgi:hypothetical protein
MGEQPGFLDLLELELIATLVWAIETKVVHTEVVRENETGV